MYRGAKGLLCVGVGTDAPPALPPSTTNVWARKLSGGKVALVFLNVGIEAATVMCDTACIEKTGLAGKSVTVRDLWKHEALAPEPKLVSLSANGLAAEGGHVMLLLTPQ